MLLGDTHGIVAILDISPSEASFAHKVFLISSGIVILHSAWSCHCFALRKI